MQCIMLCDMTGRRCPDRIRQTQTETPAHDVSGQEEKVRCEHLWHVSVVSVW